MKPSQRGLFRSTVAANVPLCREHFRLELRLENFPPTEPGQFVQIGCSSIEPEDAREIDWSEETARPSLVGSESIARQAYLRRPFSLADRRDSAGGVELDIIHRVVGAGTDWLSRLKRGGAVEILGPLGNRFEPPGADRTAVLVGGGVGIPPMLYLARKLAGTRAVAFAGAVSRDLLPLTITADPLAGEEGAKPSLCVAEFARHGIPTVLSTDDGSWGFRGFVTQALERFLDERAIQPVIYTCGPELMMKRVARIAADRGIECQVAVERVMACGMGTCQSCCIRVTKPDPAVPPLAGNPWCWRLACTDGPVFRGADLLW